MSLPKDIRNLLYHDLNLASLLRLMQVSSGLKKEIQESNIALRPIWISETVQEGNLGHQDLRVIHFEHLSRGAILQWLQSSKLDRVERLSFKSVGIGLDELLPLLRRFKSLESLSLLTDSIQDQQIEVLIRDHPNLTELRLHDVLHLSREGLHEITKLTSIQSIALGLGHLSYPDFALILPAFQNLKVFQLRNEIDTPDAVLKKFSMMPRLEVLDFGAPRLNLNQVQLLLSDLPKLSQVWLSSKNFTVPKVSRRIETKQNLSPMKVLHFNLGLISDDALNRLVHACPRITALYLDTAYRLGKLGIESILELQHLGFLELHDPLTLTQQSVTELIDRLPENSNLILSGTAYHLKPDYFSEMKGRRKGIRLYFWNN
jgi:hypothetical protein